jgi:hypothetical protein
MKVYHTHHYHTPPLLLLLPPPPTTTTTTNVILSILQVREFISKEIMPYHSQWEERGYVDRNAWKKAAEVRHTSTQLPPSSLLHHHHHHPHHPSFSLKLIIKVTFCLLLTVYFE